METTFCPGPNSNEICFALGLTDLRALELPGVENLSREFVALISALDGQRDTRFVLQTTASPAIGGDDAGRLKIHIIVAVSGVADSLPTADRLDELVDDLLDLLNAPPVRWIFEPVVGLEALKAVLEPIDSKFHAEIARREESIAQAETSFPIGFNRRSTRRTHSNPLWGMWTFGTAAEDSRRLLSVLLAQEAPVCIRVLLAPTELTSKERLLLEQLTNDVREIIPDAGLQASALLTLESLLFLRPLFEVAMIVASTERISRSLLSAIAHSVSEPVTHGGAPARLLTGGSAIIRAGDLSDRSAMDESFRRLLASQSTPSLATPGLERLRRLLGVWEAANLFRLPVSSGDSISGLSVLRVPYFDPSLDRLPTSGHEIGSVFDTEMPVLLDPEERFRHLYISGQTGTGKSTLLLSLIMQDIVAGKGVAVFDPHGDLVEAIMSRVPEERISDVVLIDPADPEAVVGVNLLEAETDAQAGFVVSELAAMFYELFDPKRTGMVGPLFETWLRQGALLLMSQPDQPSSFLDISTLFVDPAVLKHFLGQLTDPLLSEFWLGDFSRTQGSQHHQEVAAWVKSKFEIFRTSQMVRNVVGQAKSTISFSQVLREQRILLINLSKGTLGNYNSSLIGHIVFSKLWGAILERSSEAEHDRPDFFIYIDEFQNITNSSLPDVLSEARKFRVGLTLANQFFGQIPDSTARAIMGNAATRISFRVGPLDAVPFAAWLGRGILPADLTAMANYTAVAALSNNGVPIDPVLIRTFAPSVIEDSSRAKRIRAASLAKWATPIAKSEEEFFSRWAHIE
ncbi:MAG: DUF87 domain-containing protein, partial [Actinomycetes bacterium]